jgi:hypothetical protein
MKKVLLIAIFSFLINGVFGQSGTTRVTVITHGFTPSGKLGNDWKEFALRMRKKTGGTVFVNNPNTGLWEFLPLMIIKGEILLNGANGANEHKIFLYDWTAYSNNLSDGYLEASADNLFALLCTTPIGNIFDNYWHTHFIGHSRGNILLLQLAHRIASKFPSKSINHFTLLDPHPAADFMKDVSTTNEANNLPCVYGNPSVSGTCGSPNQINNTRIKLPSNIIKADEYYRQDGLYETCQPISNFLNWDWGDFDGIPVEGLGEDGIYPMGKFRRRLNNSKLKGSTRLAHSAVWQWYLHTIDQSLVPPSTDWFATANPNYLIISDDPVIINENKTTTGYFYSNEGGGFSALTNVNANKKIVLSDMNQRTINRIGETLNPIFNRKFQYGKAGWNLNGGYSSIATVSNNKAIISSDLKLDFRHSLMYYPSDAAIIRISAKYTNFGDYGANLQVKFYDDKGTSKVLVLPNGYTETGFRYFKNFTGFNNYFFAIPVALKGAVPNAKVEVNEVQLMNISGQNLRIDNTDNFVSNTNSTYFDFPVTYNLNPNPLIKGVRPSSFNATIQNTLPSIWNGTLTMTWRKVTDTGKGIPLVSKGVSLTPNATVTLDRGTQQIISEAGEYVLAIYANNDTDPIDLYYFYVEEPDEVVSQTVSITPSSINYGFGNTLVGGSASQTFTIKNTSTSNVSISNYVLTGTGFVQGTTTCCGTLAPNQSYSVNVIFQPSAVSAYNGNLQINGTFDGAPLNITLSGTGYQTTPLAIGCLESSMAAVNIITGNTDAPRQQFFTLSNTSQSGLVTVNNIQFTGADAQYFSYDSQLFSTPSTVNPAISTGFMVKVNGTLSQNRNYNASLNFSTSSPSCPTLSIPVVAINQNSTVSWVGPVAGYTAEYANGFARFDLQWQGYVQGATPIERAVQIQYSVAGGTWTHVSQSSIDCTKGHSNDQVNTDYFDLTDANSVGKKVQFRIKPCNTNVPWQYTGIFNVIESSFKPLQVISPNGYEVLTGGATYDIKWKDLLGYQSVNLAYSTDNGNSWITIATNVSGEATYYRWNVPTGIKNSNCLVKVTSANISDQSDRTFTIQPALATPITYSELFINPIGCGATPNGSVNFRLLGGQAPYYVLFVEAGLSMNTINASYVTGGMSGLDKGIHTVVITDANNNKASYTFYVPEKRIYAVKPIVTNDVCSGSKGSISVNLTGDFPYPPTFTFSKDGQQLYTGNSGSLNNISAGLYSIQTKDNENCINEQVVFVDTSPGTYFLITPTVTNTSCGSTTGAISLNIGIAQSPNYLWSNGVTTQNITGLAAGQYSVNVTDATGCVQTVRNDVVEVGGLVENKIAGIVTEGDYGCFQVNQGKLYFGNYKQTGTPTNSLGILDIQSNAYDYITIPSLFYTTSTSGLVPTTLDVTGSDIYTAVHDWNGSGTDILKFPNLPNK